MGEVGGRERGGSGYGCNGRQGQPGNQSTRMTESGGRVAICGWCGFARLFEILAQRNLSTLIPYKNIGERIEINP